jgi:hypothetical protein
MHDKPKRASEYKSEQVELVRATCLYVATRLGDMMEDLLIVGGLVPSLIIDQAAPRPGVELHVGTLDLDVGLQLALLDPDSVGPRRVAEFIGAEPNDQIQADVVGFVGALLRRLRQT